VPALEAHLDGHRVAPLREALPDADVVVTGTGVVEALAAEHLPYLKDGALLANAGHHDREIDVEALGPGEEVRPGVTRHEVAGKRVYLLAGGHLVNISGADGHPVEIMDLSFSVQALSAHLIASRDLEPGLQKLPAELDREIARTKLATLGVELDAESEAQRRFREDWTL
jgi:adenosylhomocysteinase